MRHARRPFVFLAALAASTVILGAQSPQQDGPAIAKIREEGLQRSRVMDLESYMTDVLGARLTLSEDMTRAQAWAKAEMARIGLVNVAAEPFMDYGVAWDNEYVSLHLVEPDYTPMVGYPLAHTPGTNGRQIVPAVIVDIQVKADFAKYKGTLAGKAVLVSPPVTIDLTPLVNGSPRRTDAELEKLAQTVIAPPRAAPRTVPNPDLVKADERMAFLKAESVAVVLQCDSGWIGAVRGFSRPGTRDDHWSREASLASPPIVAVTPEHYNRMYRILKRDIAVKVDVEVRNRIGERVEKAINLVGEIPGTDLADRSRDDGRPLRHVAREPERERQHVRRGSGARGSAHSEGDRRHAAADHPRGLWAGEEQGLFGSREYVNAHFGNPSDPKVGRKPAYDLLSAYFNQDYGAGQYRGLYLQGNESARALLTAWMAPFRDFGLTVVSNQSVGSTDHVPFDNAGLPGFQFLQDRIPGTGGHTNLDYFDTIQAEDLMKNAVVMAAFVYQAAMSETKVPRKKM